MFEEGKEKRERWNEGGEQKRRFGRPIKSKKKLKLLSKGKR